MNRRQREEARAEYEARRAYRSQQAQVKIDIARQREESVQAALKKKVVRRHYTLDGVRGRFADIIEKRAPKLLDLPYITAVRRVGQYEPVRPIEDWWPRGKGRDTQFRSLCEHVLAKYPTPAIVWSAFFDDNVHVYLPLIEHVAHGGSLYAWAKEHFPVPLTRKQCHELLLSPSEDGMTAAIRRIQVRTAGGDRRFFEAWRRTREATRIGTKENETFWYTVVEWFSKLQMLEPGQVGPLVDYIEHRRHEDPTFSMKGRSVAALVEGMRAWHGTLSIRRSIDFSAIFRTSGFKPAVFGDYERTENGQKVKEVWRVTELLTAKALHEEGSRMNHCVWSYSNRVQSGDTSIWSVTMEDGHGATGNWAMVTLEVRNGTRTVVQARGRYNRQMTGKELQVVNRWAGQNNLLLNLGRW